MTDSLWLYYLWACLLLVSNLFGFALNFLGLPGNWLILSGAALFAWLVDFGTRGMGWPVVLLLACLAVGGEAIEFLAGTIGAAKQGASRKAMALSVVGSIAGSIFGAIVGLPIPIVGSAVGALLGGALGAAAGAALGEDWSGRDLDASVNVGVAAFWGRILGTAGKVCIGATMLVIATVDSLLL